MRVSDGVQPTDYNVIYDNAGPLANVAGPASVRRAAALGPADTEEEEQGKGGRQGDTHGEE